MSEVYGAAAACYLFIESFSGKVDLDMGKKLLLIGSAVSLIAARISVYWYRWVPARDMSCLRLEPAMLFVRTFR